MFLTAVFFLIKRGYNFDTANQGWIKCGSGEHRSQEMTRKIEEIVTLGYEEKEKREEEEKEKREEEKEKREEEEREEEEKKK